MSHFCPISSHIYKRILEDRIRKTRRQEKIGEFRPLLSTPNIKRSRDDDGVWDTTNTPAMLTDTSRTPVTPVRKTQTPIMNFLKKITKEEQIANHLRDTELKMSSSSSLAKPVFVNKAASKVKSGAKKMVQMKPGKVTSILQYFENSRDVPKSSKVIIRRNSSYNNSMLYPPQLGQTVTNSDRAGQQMAPQPIIAVSTEQPITDPCLGHVTAFQTSPPINSSQARPSENPEENGHL